MSNRANPGVFLLLSGILLLTFVPPVAAQHEGHEASQQLEESATLWTCSMHPHIRLPKPGKCPICSMDLIPVSSDRSSDEDPAGSSITLNRSESILTEVETTPVEKKWVEREVRLVGRIDYDETRLRHITAWVPGRIDRMFVDYSGIVVREGDHMVSLYSPELVSAQEELIQASRSLARIKGGSELVQRSTRRSLSAARDKLKLLGLTERQVTQIERRGRAEDSVTIYSPMGGTVVEKMVNEGMYVQTGTRIYAIADLSHLWLILDAYESDLAWLAYGQDVEFIAEALPGETFKGLVSFIQPIVDERTRTVKVRVNVENPSKRLKPGMFVTAVVKSRVDEEGKVITASYEGKYVCPMHPEVVRDEEETCPVCGMDLVHARSLPFVGNRNRAEAEPPLVIPASAPLITGVRAVVYLKLPNRREYQGREVLLGPRAGDYYIVKEGLREGDLVVTNGAFKLDADLQIRGEVSMMNPDGMVQNGGHSHGNPDNKRTNEKVHSGHEISGANAAQSRTLGEKEWAVLKGYLQLSDALAHDNFVEAKEAFSVIATAAEALGVGEIKQIFNKHDSNLEDREDARRVFGELTEFLLPRFEEYHIPAELAVFKVYCPMALDGKGAEWLQRGEEIKNPYFGKAMLSCGELRGEL